MERLISEEASLRFWAKVDKNGPVPAHRPELGPCWVWTASTLGKGYGAFGLNRRTAMAHRVAYEIEHGPIPDGLCVLHECDNPPCVRHLFLGTRGDNATDRATKRRQPFGESHWKAKLTEVDVLAIRKEYASGTVTRRDLSNRYSVTAACIGRIVRRETWTHT